MSYITEIFERADLRHISEFLLYGDECFEVSDKTYEERLESAGKPVFKMLDEKFPEIKENDKIAAIINHYTVTIQDVYMEIGMQCGAVLAMKLFAKNL